MKFSIDWLKEFVPVPLKVLELSHRLTMQGLEVEHIEGEGEKAVFTLGITPNRGDCLSLLGLAREVSALQGKPLVLKPKIPPKGQTPIKNFLKVSIPDRKGCPRYMARVVQGVRIGPSPDWMQKRLASVGLKAINNVVDCTNYVMWELGQPLHAFDYRFLKEGRIVVRPEPRPFKFVTLDGVERACLPSDLFICDGEGPVALAGI
ncbi:MAG: phenylalanine--tRNA ligase beta subunit-related protein, partial [bacterium]|nr:phenylalanine--tRNA ligase beta subunit-related protein [bacterium]